MLVAAAPAWGASVLVVSADEASRNLKDDITEVLSSTKAVVKVAGPKAPATACLTVSPPRRQECFATAGGAANVETLLLVSTKESGHALVVTFEALSATDGKTQRREVLRTTDTKWKTAAPPVLKRLISSSGAGKHRPDSAAPSPRKPDPVAAPAPMTRAPEPVVDRPTDLVLEPRSTSTDSTAALVAAAPARSTSRTGAWVATGTAVVAAGVAGTFAGLGFSNQAHLQRTTDGVSPLTYSQAQGLQRASNTQLSVALVATVAASISGGVAAVLWSRN